MQKMTLGILATRFDDYCGRNDEAHQAIIARLDKANDGAEHRQAQINELVLNEARRQGAEEAVSALVKKLIPIAVAAASALSTAGAILVEKFLK